MEGSAKAVPSYFYADDLQHIPDILIKEFPSIVFSLQLFAFPEMQIETGYRYPKL